MTVNEAIIKSSLPSAGCMKISEAPSKVLRCLSKQVCCHNGPEVADGLVS